MKASLAFLIATVTGFSASAQISINGGSYSQNFNSLATSGAGWINNTTLPGWYASRGSADNTNYLAGTGSGNTGGVYSFGVNGVSNVTDRALGSIASGSTTTIGFGIRFTNDTALAQTNIAISYTGEQWRSGSATTPQTLVFYYQVSDLPITNTYSASGWINVGALNFVSPNLSASSLALDGNNPANRHVFAGIVLTGVVVQPGKEFFLRWVDVDDTGTDNGLAIDDLTVDFGTAVLPTAPSITVQPQSQAVTEGDNVTFTVVANGTPPPTYQWQFNNTNVDNETNNSFTLTGVTTNQTGDYSVIVSNSVGFTNSDVATLTVSSLAGTLKLVQYNVKGNGATDWTTNATQVQAIGRQVMYLNPDFITFNEIPNDLYFEMTDFVTAYLPGYHLAINSGTDGFIRSAIVSRFPIIRSQKWLDGADLKPFGYTNTSSGAADNFTRDLFEAEIAVPGFAQHWHVFTSHLKSSSGGYAEAAAKRSAEAAAITNFFATNLFVLYPNHPYTLSGDMNEDNASTLAIQQLITAPTGLHLTSPVNPFTGSFDTYSTLGANPSSRLDYIFPCTLLFSNIASSQVFRTDKLSPLPPDLNSDDCKIASDHFPVVMVFNNPYNKPFQLLPVVLSNQNLTLTWQSVPGQAYRVEVSSNLMDWTTFASNLTAEDYVFSLTTNSVGDTRLFRVSRGP